MTYHELFAAEERRGRAIAARHGDKFVTTGLALMHGDGLLHEAAELPLEPSRPEPDRSCELCVHDFDHGWWGDTILKTYSHCRTCHVTFPGSNKWGHCSGCHHTFAGIDAFDSHQRVTKDGDIHPQSLCAVSSTKTGKESILDAPHERRFDVSAAYTLVFREAEWGWYWGRETDGENPWRGPSDGDVQ